MLMESSQLQKERCKIADCYQGVIYHQITYNYCLLVVFFLASLLPALGWKWGSWFCHFLLATILESGITASPEERIIPILLSRFFRIQMEVNCKRSMLSWGWAFSPSQLSPNETERSSPGSRTAWDEKGLVIPSSLRQKVSAQMQIIWI